MQDSEGIRLRIDSEGDIIRVRQTVREITSSLGFGLTDVTRIVTAASELTRNIFLYAGTGTMSWRRLNSSSGLGIELTFEDNGPGIADINQALEPGYTTSGGLGLGLPGARRLMDELTVESTVGVGTRVTIRKWLRRR